MPAEIVLHVEPGVVKSWNVFREQSPEFSIALDGYVDGPPSFDAAGPFANFDHHFGVNRLATRSTSGQVLVAISLGLFDTFQADGRGFANVFVNDCDQDVCLAYWLLSNPDLVVDLRLDMDIAKLIIAEDFLDATGGAYPVDLSRPGMRKLVWIFEPYADARLTGRLGHMSAEEMRSLIMETADRITRLSAGKSGEADVIGEYEELGGGSQWRMIREHGPFARTKLFADGIRAFVAVRDQGDGRYAYTVGRMSPFINFPMVRIYERLNEAEGTATGTDKWGGSDTIGGSPRRRGS